MRLFEQKGGQYCKIYFPVFGIKHMTTMYVQLCVYYNVSVCLHGCLHMC